jgi:hypothetical protein
MHIKRGNGQIVMMETINCVNYFDMKHIGNELKEIGKNEYICEKCNAIMTFKEPVLVQDENGRLRMKVVAEVKQ